MYERFAGLSLHYFPTCSAGILTVTTSRSLRPANSKGLNCGQLPAPKIHRIGEARSRVSLVPLGRTERLAVEAPSQRRGFVNTESTVTRFAHASALVTSRATYVYFESGNADLTPSIIRSLASLIAEP